MVKSGASKQGKKKGGVLAYAAVPDAPNCATIFGGGIAGLTAAHELVERGFRVQVWEPADNPRHPHRGCEVGGMARTQWARVPWPDSKRLDVFQPGPIEPEKHPTGLQATKIVPLPQKLSFTRGEIPQCLQELIPAESDPTKFKFEDPTDNLREALNAEGKTWVEVAVREWDAMTDKQREALIKMHVGLLVPFLVRELPSDLATSTPNVVPFYDRGSRVWRLIPDEGRDLTFTWVGGFETAASQRLPADTRAVLRIWRGDRYERSKETQNLFVFNAPWDPGRMHALGARGERDPRKVAEEFIGTLDENPTLNHIYVEVSERDFQYLTDDERLQRAAAIAGRLQKILPKDVKLDGPKGASVPPSDVPVARRMTAKLHLASKRAVHLEIVPLAAFPTRAPAAAHLLVSFRVRERWLPGEHGYRFFPAFYRHVFDTMQRTPLLEIERKTEFAQEQERAVDIDTPEAYRYIEDGRTVRDNVQGTTKHALAFEDGRRPNVLSRSAPKSFRELREYVNVLFGSEEAGGFAINPRESTRFALKLFKYMTSCDERRREYEEITWWEFVDGDSYSSKVQTLIQRWPEALVAMDAKSADARSHGTAFVQLVLDNIRPGGYRDGTLRGPTSEAWLKHWRRYLEAQGVEFIHGELAGFELITTKDGHQRVWPEVKCYEPRLRRDTKADDNPPLMPGYFVLAPSADKVAALAEKFREKAKLVDAVAPPELSDMHKATSIDASERELAKPQPGNDFRHFAGIQFYFAEDILFVDGHVYYPDSPWGLTSISQVRFWEDRTDWEHGFRGLLSAIIGIWDKEGEKIRKPAWKCRPDEIAQEVWYQIEKSVKGSGRDSVKSRFRLGSRSSSNRIPQPIYWHLDEFLEYEKDGKSEKKKYTNKSPFHIASPTGWSGRPGDPEKGYQVEHGWVLCGMYMKTYTRIPTMEAANESARHAVNAILEHSEKCTDGEHQHRYRGSHCDTWNPEDYEVEDFDWFLELDQTLVSRGLPHIVDILDVDRLLDTLGRGGPEDPLDPISIMRRLRRLSAEFT